MSERASKETSHPERDHARSPRRGEPVPHEVERAWSPALGSLSDVRVHTDSASAAFARDLGASAVTNGRDIHFAHGAFRPDTASGRELIGHELIHAAQPMSADARGVAPPDHPAEREADRGARTRPREVRTGMHRFLPSVATTGLRPGEILPAPLAMAVAGDRFSIALEVDPQRQLAFVITMHGDLAVSAPGLAGRVLRLPVLDLEHPLAIQQVEQRTDTVAWDLYGDGSEIVRFADSAELAPSGATRRHTFLANRGGYLAVYHMQEVKTTLEVTLPVAPMGIGEAGTGTADRVVTTTFHDYGDLFSLSVRRFGNDHVAVTIAGMLIAEHLGTNPTTQLRLSVPPEHLTATILRHEGSTMEVEVDGDGRADLRYDHRASDRVITDVDAAHTQYRERTHVFYAYNARGERIPPLYNQHVQRHTIDEVLPAIPASGVPVQSQAEEDIGVQPAPDAAPVDIADRIAELTTATQRSGGVLDLRVDADGDRRHELLLRFRPPVRGPVLQPHYDYSVYIMQISSRQVATLTLALAPEQEQNVLPAIARLADGVSPLVVDVVRFPRIGMAAVDPVTLEIAPPTDQPNGEIMYEVLVTGAAGAPISTPIFFPREAEQAPSLVSDAQASQVGGVYVVEATLGEFGDRFRFTLSNHDQELLGVSALDRGHPGETRPVRLVAGTLAPPLTPQLLLPAAATPPPWLASHAPQTLEITLGERDIVISDAIGTDPSERMQDNPDPLTNRTHHMAIAGTALRERRTLRFDYFNGRFRTTERTGLEMPELNAQAGTPLARGQLDRIHRSAVAIARSMHAALDQGIVSEAEFDALRDSLRTMIPLRVISSEPAMAPSLPGAKSHAWAAIHTWAGMAVMPLDGFLETVASKITADDFDGAFESFAFALDVYDRGLYSVVTGPNAAQQDVAAAAAAVDVIRPLVAEGRSLDAIVQRIDTAISAEVVQAHQTGVINDAMFDAWNQLRLARPALMRSQAREARDQNCEVEPAVQTAIANARRLQAELVAATTAANETRLDFTHEQASLGPTGALVYAGGDGDAMATAIGLHDWSAAWTAYAALDEAIDRWVTNRLEARDREAGSTGPAHDALLHNQYVHRMHEQLAGLPANAFPVAAAFSPDTEYANEQGFVASMPIRLFVWHDGQAWQLRDLTNPEHTFEVPSVYGLVENGPPDALFQELNHRARFPKGVLYYQVADGLGGRVVCTAEKRWYDWAREIGLALAAAGFIFATFGTGTVAVIGAGFLAASGVVNAAAAAGQLIDDAQHGIATRTSVLINVFDIIASLAGAGSLVAGTVTSTAAQAARTGVAWTGAAAEVAAFADKVYVPLAATGLGANVGMAAVMTADTLHQLNEIDNTSGLSREQRAEAKRGLLVQLALVGGLTAMSVHGELPELLSGRRTIVLDVIRFPNGEEVAVARAAGVRFRGEDLDIAAGASAREHATARWQAAEAEAGRIPGLDDNPERPRAFRKWLEMPDRITFNPDGSPHVNVPTHIDGVAVTEETQAWLRSLAGPDSALVRAERAFAIADRLAAGTGERLAIDPLSPDWPQTRRQVVQRLGGGAEAEATVARFERARLGNLGGGAEFRAQRAQLNKLLPDEDLERLRSVFGGYEVYATGAALDPAADLAHLDHVDLVVAVPPDVSPDLMAAIEQRASLARIHPDPELLEKAGLPADTTIGVRARVVPTDAVVGLAGGSVLHRIDDVARTLGMQLDNVVAAHLRTLGVAADSIPFRVQVIPEDDFRRTFASVRGRSVIQLETDRAVIYARPDATRLDMLDEASHLAQAADPALEHDLRILSGENFGDWHAAPAQSRLEMYQTKLGLEIDAKQRTLTALRNSGTATEAELAEVQGQLDQLQARQREVAAITPEHLSMMNAGAEPLPAYLDEPPWLFSKGREIEGTVVNRNALAPNTQRTVVTDSTARGAGVTVRRVGNSWRERTLVTSNFDGEVTAIDTTPERTLITIRRPTGGDQTYLVEPGAQLRVAVGDRVGNGGTLAVESDREYRLVEIAQGTGTSMREEIRMPDDSWRQRGSESRARGLLMEDAARLQVNAQLTLAKLEGRISDFFHIPHSRGGGGFDDVIVEFTGTGPATQARVRIREIKDYPGRSVPLEEFTAIRGNGLTENMDILRGNVEQAVAAVRDGLRPSGVFAAMTDDQVRALNAAVAEHGNAVTVEVVTGPTTRIGTPGHHAATVMDDLQREVDAELGVGAFVARPGVRAESVDQSYVDQALRARGAP